MSAYSPSTVELLSFAKSVPDFLDGSDTPRDYLERCIETIESKEPEVQAFSALNFEGARAAADAATVCAESDAADSPSATS